ncbi:MAG: helix-turn-helix transcriptional regulator [Actinobacteria bacterium]|nr:helix-turn-helix transcriptional regulator [Actinomycetota bacterium]
MKELEKNFNDLVGRRVREYRIKQNASQEELGKYLKLPKQAVSSIEKGKRRVTAQELDMISLFFDKPLSAFIKEEYEYVYPYDADFGVIPIFIAEFLEKYKYAYENIQFFKKHGKKFTKRLIDGMKIIQREAGNKKK